MNTALKEIGPAKCERQALFPCVTLHQLNAVELVGFKLELDSVAYKQVSNAT